LSNVNGGVRRKAEVVGKEKKRARSPPDIGHKKEGRRPQANSREKRTDL